MADDVGSLATAVVAKVCPANECPYRYGSSEGIKIRLGERLAQKIKHRLADGQEVRKLEGRVEILEKALTMCLGKATTNMTFTPKEIGEIKKALNPDKKG